MSWIICGSQADISQVRGLKGGGGNLDKFWRYTASFQKILMLKKNLLSDINAIVVDA